MMVNTIVKKISEHLNRLYIARIGSALTGKGEQTMTDREKVTKGLECCSVLEGKCEECPYDTEGYVGECVYALARDALALLKEQQTKIEQLEDELENAW